MPSSLCFNCGAPKSAPFTAIYCDDCTSLVAAAREEATQNNQNPSEAARRALATRSFSKMSNRPHPSEPINTRAATIAAMRAHFDADSGL